MTRLKPVLTCRQKPRNQAQLAGLRGIPEWPSRAGKPGFAQCRRLSSSGAGSRSLLSSVIRSARLMAKTDINTVLVDAVTWLYPFIWQICLGP